MLGALVGDIVGSLRENRNVLSKEFDLFPKGSTYTDDTVLTIAVCEWLLDGRPIAELFHEYFQRYPSAGFGAGFRRWALSDVSLHGTSFGNGSAMRVSPVAYAFEDQNQVLDFAFQSAVVSHDHPEGIKGAQAIALATFLARTTKDKDLIKAEVTKHSGYPLHLNMADLRLITNGEFNPTCQWTCPIALIAYFESHSFEDAIRNAISLGGDSDTIAAMAGGIAAAHYGIPEEIATITRRLLPGEFRETLDRFEARYPDAKNLLPS